jgi:hypothetical protein
MVLGLKEFSKFNSLIDTVMVQRGIDEPGVQSEEN